MARKTDAVHRPRAFGPVVVAAAVVIREGRVLLTRRAEGQHLAGLWEFPGGKLEDGESPEEALVRECREECGIEVAVSEILEVTHHRYPQKTGLHPQTAGTHC